MSDIAACKGIAWAGTLSVEGSETSRAGQALIWKGTGARLAGDMAGGAEEVGGITAIEIVRRASTSPIEGCEITSTGQALTFEHSGASFAIG